MENKISILALIFTICVTLAIGTVHASHNEQTSRETRDPRIAVVDSNVYVVWSDSTNPDYWDVYFAKSSDDGKTFSDTINLTNGSSYYPNSKILVSGNNVYVSWEDRTSPDGTDAIFFTKSNDGGVTFDKPRILDPVNDPVNLIYRPRVMLASNDILYVFASEWSMQTKQNKMIFVTSNDGGDTFSKPITLFEADQWEDFVDYAISDDGTTYVLVDDKKNYDEVGDLNLRKIFPDGTISDIILVNGGKTAVTNAELALSKDNVYITWRAWEKNRWHLAFAKSHDGGDTFSKPVILNSDPSSIDTVGSEGSGIFAHDDSVFVISREEYWDGTNQSFHIWIAASHNLGDDFDVVIHPLDDLLYQYGQILTVQQDQNLYSFAMTTKNPPFNKDALYFARSDDGKSFTGPVDVLENNPPGFQYVNVATQNDSIHLVATGNYDAKCILYTSSHDKGNSFSEMKNLSPNGTPKQCLGIEEQMPSPKHQMKLGVQAEDIKCKEDLAKGYILTLKQDGQPLCVTATSFEKILERGIVSERSFETIALSAAKNYLLSHPKTDTNIVEDSLELKIYMTRHSIPPTFIIRGTFESIAPIYDGDADPLNHSIGITLVQNNKVHAAKLDNTYALTGSDDLQQSSIRENTIVSPTLKTILTPGERVDNRGMIPLVITEVSEGGFDLTTHWTFQSIGYGGDNRDKKWGFLPDKYVISETVDQDGKDAIDRKRMPENFGIPAPLFLFPTLCEGKERIEGESGWHYTLPTRTDTSMVYFRSTDKGIYPDENGVYDIRFVSIFKTEVKLPPNTQVIINKTILCPMEKTLNDATHAYYTRLEFKIDDKWATDSKTESDGIDTHATLLVKIFGDKFDFSRPEFQLQDPKINFEPATQDLIHRNSDDATLGFLFETLKMKLSKECFVFSDKKEFCNSDEHSLKFYVNDEQKEDISQYVIAEDDRILISYGAESKQEVAEQLAELESMAKYNYVSLDKLMTMDVGTVKDGTYDKDLGFRTFEKLMTIDIERQTEQNALKNALSQKQYAYETLVQQKADQKTLESLQNEIKQIELQLNDLTNKKEQYTTEEIFQRVSEIEAENIKMYKIGPEEYKKYVAAKNTFENEMMNGTIPVASVQINPETKLLEIILQKNVKDNTVDIERYKSIIDKIMPDDISWDLVFSE